MQTRRTSIRKNEATPSTEATPPASASTEATPPAGAAPAAASASTEAAPPADTSTETTPNTPSMDELAARVAEAEKGLGDATKSFTPAEFATYVNEQLEKAKTEDAEKAGARYKALQTAIGLAKVAFDAGGSASIAVFNDSWQAETTTKTIESPTGVTSGTSNIGYPTNVDTAKRMLIVAKELRKEDSELAKALPVALEKSFASPVEKASDAAALLEKIASVFGVKATNDYGEYSGLGWRVENVIHALESAARMDKALTAMAAAFGTAAAPAPAPEAGEVEAAAKAALAKSASTPHATTDDVDYPALGAATDVDGWPCDMNAGRRLSKSAREEITF